eukprot:356243-Chlamydomonas_euryale.AAC.8
MCGWISVLWLTISRSTYLVICACAGGSGTAAKDEPHPGAWQKHPRGYVPPLFPPPPSPFLQVRAPHCGCGRCGMRPPFWGQRAPRPAAAGAAGLTALQGAGRRVANSPTSTRTTAWRERPLHIPPPHAPHMPKPHSATPRPTHAQTTFRHPTPYTCPNHIPPPHALLMPIPPRFQMNFHSDAFKAELEWQKWPCTAMGLWRPCTAMGLWRPCMTWTAVLPHATAQRNSFRQQPQARAA